MVPFGEEEMEEFKSFVEEETQAIGTSNSVLTAPGLVVNNMREEEADEMNWCILDSSKDPFSLHVLSLSPP